MSSRKKRTAPSVDAEPVATDEPVATSEEPEVTDAEPPPPEADAPVEDAAGEGAPDAAAPGDEPAEADDDEVSIEDTHAYLKGLIEAILYVSDRPLTIKELARAARTDKKRAGELVEELKQDLVGHGLRIDEVADGIVFRTNPVYATYVRNFLEQRPVRLSRAQLETLSIIAYRQPITRPEIDDIRGVDCGPVLKGLLERDLVRIIGKKDEPGRPMLYGTTPTFLELFSLNSLRELPTLKEFTELNDDSRRKFEQETGEEAPEGPIEVDAPTASDVEGEDAKVADAPDAGEGGRSGAAGDADATPVSDNDGAPDEAPAAVDASSDEADAGDDEDEDDEDDEDDDDDDDEDEDEDDDDDDD